VGLLHFGIVLICSQMLDNGQNAHLNEALMDIEQNELKFGAKKAL